MARNGSTIVRKAKAKSRGINFRRKTAPIKNTKSNLCFIKLLRDQDYEMAMLCIDAFSKYCDISVQVKQRERVVSRFHRMHEQDGETIYIQMEKRP